MTTWMERQQQVTKALKAHYDAKSVRDAEQYMQIAQQLVGQALRVDKRELPAHWKGFDRKRRR